MELGTAQQPSCGDCHAHLCPLHTLPLTSIANKKGDQASRLAPCPKYFLYYVDRVMKALFDLLAITRRQYREAETQLKCLRPEAPPDYRSLAYVRTLLRPRDLAS